MLARRSGPHQERISGGGGALRTSARKCTTDEQDDEEAKAEEVKKAAVPCAPHPEDEEAAAAAAAAMAAAKGAPHPGAGWTNAAAITKAGVPNEAIIAQVRVVLRCVASRCVALRCVVWSWLYCMSFSICMRPFAATAYAPALHHSYFLLPTSCFPLPGDGGVSRRYDRG